MRRLTLALLGVGVAAAPLRAQQVPGRELLEFPIATLGEAPALARESAGGFWNPAQAALEGGRLRLTATALNTPVEQGVAAYFLGASGRAPGGYLASVTVVKALVADLLHTETDPQSLGDEIPYSTTIISAGLSRRLSGVSLGVALRHRSAVADLERGAATSLDAGVGIDSVGRFPLRLGASSFLFSPWGRSRERAQLSLAGDYALLRRGTQEARVGAALSSTESAGNERYLFASGRWGLVSARGGLATSRYAGNSTERMRLGFGLHYSRYEVGISREDSGAGLGPSYQFMISSVIR